MSPDENEEFKRHIAESLPKINPNYKPLPKVKERPPMSVMGDLDIGFGQKSQLAR